MHSINNVLHCLGIFRSNQGYFITQKTTSDGRERAGEAFSLLPIVVNTQLRLEQQQHDNNNNNNNQGHTDIQQKQQQRKRKQATTTNQKRNNNNNKKNNNCVMLIIFNNKQTTKIVSKFFATFNDDLKLNKL